MLRGLVFGDLWGIKEGIWIQLWSGAVGAVVSAAVAALVAVVVLTRSNEHQRKLSEEALRMQSQLADEQLLEQREAAKNQLSEQRRATDIARERAAIADAVVAAERFRSFSLDGHSPLQEVGNRIPDFSAAVTRWRLELLGDPLAHEVGYWHNAILMTVTKRASAKTMGVPDEEFASAVAMHVAIDALNTVAFTRHRPEGDELSGLTRRLDDARAEYEAYVRSLNDEEPPGAVPAPVPPE